VLPQVATLEVETAPPGAAVVVNGTPRGLSPLALPQLPPGDHTVRVTHEGYAPAELSLELRAGTVVPLRFTLQRLAPRPSPTPQPRPVAAALRPTPPPLRPGDVVDSGGELPPPRRIAGKPPGYPEAAMRLRLQGTVEVEMILSLTGVPEQIGIVQSAGAVLDETVIEAVHDFRYEPAVLRGVPVRVRHRYRQEFRLRE
jgi:TonB family protein